MNNKLQTIRHYATELLDSEDPVTIEDATTTIAYCDKVEAGDYPLIADEMAIYEARIIELLIRP